MGNVYALGRIRILGNLTNTVILGFLSRGNKKVVEEYKRGCSLSSGNAKPNMTQKQREVPWYYTARRGFCVTTVAQRRM